MHRQHLAGCLAGVALVLVAVTLFGSAGSLGVLAIALICPIAMTAAMWFFMGSDHGRHE